MLVGWTGFSKGAWGVELLPKEQTDLVNAVGSRVTVTRRSSENGPDIVATGIVTRVQLRTGDVDNKIYREFLTLSI